MTKPELNASGFVMQLLTFSFNDNPAAALNAPKQPKACKPFEGSHAKQWG